MSEPTGRRVHRRAAARHPAAGQRRAALGAGAGPAAAVRLPAPRPAGSPAPTSAASTACAARAPCSSTAQPMRSCLMFAVSAQAHEITTIEGIGNDPESA